ncbi:MAG TPA: DUF1684 domain-containing protein [Dokdonella sp.]|uniref:DUF1684 domain-containing protein n=1 Tax=Dokdonella sp. TaxID=2291710 RepID=UPI0025BAC5E3|nr:DUF1684 domain-containing protein [Dokdonella sp.]MBX3691906.1 DUF1684 domain-containing protein [Dokdonella sp.]MCW5568927.1 DUF1684 domain-containing protein [Dokdonella sp.]HNR90854.1 DUF1684 domain-containing protein [Dokdonella sp.]
MRRALLLAAIVALSAPLHADDEHARSVEEWRAARIASLQKPDGWFSFVGSGMVREGESTVGRGAGNAIVLAKGPDRLGTLRLDTDGRVHFRADAKADATIDGAPIKGEVELQTNADGQRPTEVHFGKAWFYVVRSGDVTSWRLRDPESPALAAFKGIETFPTDPSWRIVADWQPYDPPHAIELVTIINTLQTAEVPGKAVFTRDGTSFSLEPVVEDDGRLFFIIADRTSGKETYGAARFLYADPPQDGKVVLDFNLAYNPPCALSPHVVCPTAPPQNRLAVRVTAGEKKYAVH